MSLNNEITYKYRKYSKQKYYRNARLELKKIVI